MSFFEDEQNPFADPSIRNATQSQQPATIDFNPFEKSTSSAPKPLPPPPSASDWPATGAFQPTVGSSVMREELPPPAYAVSAAEKVTRDDIDRRQRELDAKAAEIQRREEALARQAASVRAANNWPPLPSFCPLQPCYYQDFDIDIPSPYRKLVRNGYYIALGHLLVYALNSIIGFAFFMVTITNSNCISGTNNQSCASAGTTFGFSLLWLVLFGPASYVCWFRPLYKAFKNDSSMNFFWFFFVSLGQFIVDLVWALGFYGSGSLGFLNGSSMFQIDSGMAVTMLLVGSMSAVLAGSVALLVYFVHRVYRATGASFEKARQELAQGAMSSSVMRDAVAAGTQAAVTGAVSNAVGQSSSSSAHY